MSDRKKKKNRRQSQKDFTRLRRGTNKGIMGKFRGKGVLSMQTRGGNIGGTSIEESQFDKRVGEKKGREKQLKQDKRYGGRKYWKLD